MANYWVFNVKMHNVSGIHSPFFPSQYPNRIVLVTDHKRIQAGQLVWWQGYLQRKIIILIEHILHFMVENYDYRHSKCIECFCYTYVVWKAYSIQGLFTLRTLNLPCHFNTVLGADRAGDTLRLM